VDWSAVRVLLARDLGAIKRSKALVLPMLMLPVVLLVLLPAAVGLAANGKQLDISRFIQFLPSGLAEPILAYPENEQLVILVLGYLVAPLFLIVPLMVSAVTASDTFAGEKERRTLETLLHLPVRDRDLYIAKLLGGFIPATAVSWLGFVLFTIISNIVCWPVMHRLFLPTWLWMIVIFWLAPAVAALGLGIMVRVSMRVSNTQEAQQLGGAVVMPLVILAVGQTTSILLRGPATAFVAGVAIWAVAIVLNVRGARSFTRDRMAARL
jgi:ABC-type Na+ efflux pump permease subunit